MRGCVTRRNSAVARSPASTPNGSGTVATAPTLPHGQQMTRTGNQSGWEPFSRRIYSSQFAVSENLCLYQRRRWRHVGSLRGLRAREVGEDGCVLVRPDMHIAWRANGMADDPAAEPLDVMSRILPLPIW